MSAVNVTLHFILRSERPGPDGACAIYLRVTANRKRSKIATGIAVRPSDWNARRMQVRRSHPLAAVYNAKLEDLHAQATVVAMTATTAKEVTSAMRGRGRATIVAYGAKHLERLAADGAAWEVKKYRTTLRKAKACFGEMATFDEITRKHLANFERYLRVDVGNRPNTVRKELDRLRRLFLLATRDGVTEADPFRAFNMPKGERTAKRKLSRAEFGALVGVDLDASHDAALALARNAFAFAVYGGGIRFGDVCTLRLGDVVNTEKGERLHYQMNKTGAPVSLLIPPEAVDIWEYYAQGAEKRGGFLFPFLDAGDDRDPVHLRRRIASRNVVVNRDLKRLADRAGIETKGLSFHIARHTSADFMRVASGGDVYAVSKVLGHSTPTTTTRYLADFDRDAMDALTSATWSKE